LDLALLIGKSNITVGNVLYITQLRRANEKVGGGSGDSVA